MDYLAFLAMRDRPTGAIAADGDSSVARIHSQGGAFTVHGDLSLPLERVAPDALTCHALPIGAIPEAKEFLELAGVSEFSIYPDLAGLAKDVNFRELG
jgi:hypothetical protein